MWTANLHFPHILHACAAKLLAMQAEPGSTVVTNTGTLAVAVLRTSTEGTAGSLTVAFPTGAGTTVSTRIPASFSSWCTGNDVCKRLVGAELADQCRHGVASPCRRSARELAH